MQNLVYGLRGIPLLKLSEKSETLLRCGLMCHQKELFGPFRPPIRSKFGIGALLESLFGQFLYDVG
jgi:hypothetical protein